MNINFQISGIDGSPFNHLFDLDEQTLRDIGAVKMIANEHPGFPCRVSLEDAEIGEEVLLFPYDHHRVNSPYQASGPIFIRKNAQLAQLKKNEIPKMLLHRLLSLRVYDSGGMMVDAKTVEGQGLRSVLEEIFGEERVAYVHVHNSGPGCFNCGVGRG